MNGYVLSLESIAIVVLAAFVVGLIVGVLLTRPRAF